MTELSVLMYEEHPFLISLFDLWDGSSRCSVV